MQNYKEIVYTIVFSIYPVYTIRNSLFCEADLQLGSVNTQDYVPVWFKISVARYASRSSFLLLL